MTYQLEAKVVNPDTQSFRLGFSRIGVQPLGGTVGTGFILGVSRLSVASLGSDYGYIWKDFTGRSTGIVTKRGSSMAGPCIWGEVGTLTATFKNGGDTDLSINLGIGSPLRLRDIEANHVVWTGFLADTVWSAVKGSSNYYVTWTGVDVMSRLSRKVGGLPAASFANRMSTLALQAGLTHPVPSANDTVLGWVDDDRVIVGADRYDLTVALGGVTESMTIVEHMDAACASTRSMYFVGEDGNIVCSPDWGPTTVIPDPPLVTNYTAIESGLTSKTIINALNVDNKALGYADQGFVLVYAESVERYGQRTQDINMCVETPAYAMVVASDYLRTASDGEFSAQSFSGPNRFPPTAASPDPLGQPIRITQNGKTARAWVINEQITIKPKQLSGNGQSVHYAYGVGPRQLMQNTAFQGV